MKIFLLIITILLYISCGRNSENQTNTILKQMYSSEVQQTINLLKKRNSLNPVKVMPWYDRAIFINNEFKKIDTILNSRNKQLLLDFLNRIIDSYGKNRLSKDSMLYSRINILRDVIEKNKIDYPDCSVLFSELQFTLIKKLYEFVDENEYK
jgi:hypothetical protein